MTKSIYKQIMELDELASPPYTSKISNKRSKESLGKMTTILRKAENDIAKIMTSDFKSKKYTPLDLHRTIQQGDIKATTGFERDFIQQLWDKIRHNISRGN